MADNIKKPGLLRRFFCGIWNTINFTRRLVFNLLFLVVVMAILAGVFAAQPKLESRTALVIDPKGEIVEQYTLGASERALFGLTGNEAHQVQLRDLLRVIDGASKDPLIERIVLVPDDIEGGGLSTLRELGQALDRFRSTGKEVVALADSMRQRQYFLAAHADRILLDPDGAVLLEGLANYRAYFKDALDKLGVKVHLIKVGEFKSAGESFVLNQSSAEAKEADRYWMSGIWQEYLDEIAALRKIDAKALEDDIVHFDTRVAEYQGDLAQLALAQKLVDQLATRAQAREYLKSRGLPDAEGTNFRQINYKNYLSRMQYESPLDTRPEIAVIVAQGEILPGEQPQGMVGGQSTARLIRAVREDDEIKAVVLRVNSPGGEVYASELIRREIELTHAIGKPVVVSMGDVAASGGYWISMNADEIWAQPVTITGSIGIFGLIPTIPDALAKLGIHTDGVATTPLAGGLDIRRPLSTQIESILTSVIHREYRKFITNIAKARGREPADIDAIAQGRVWSGTQAKERGLVDKLGGLQDAITAAAARASISENYQTRYMEKELNFWEYLALSVSDNRTMMDFARFAGVALPSGILSNSESRQIRAVVATLRGKPYGVFAQCFCELQ